MKASKQQPTFGVALERLRTYIRENNKRQTSERELLLRVVCSFPAQFTAEQLQLMAHAANSTLRISRATIYNALQTFVDAQLLVECPSPNGSKVVRYELCLDKSSTMLFRCTECGAVHRFSDPFVKNAIMGRKYANFMPGNFTLYVYGKCRICRSEQRRKRDKNPEMPEMPKSAPTADIKEKKNPSRNRKIKTIPTKNSSQETTDESTK